MTSEHQADQQHLEAAMAYAVSGDRVAAGAELARIYNKGTNHMYRVWVALAETAVHPIREAGRPGAVYGLSVLNADSGRRTSIDEAPPGVRLATQFLTAQANQDTDTTRALFRAALAGQVEVMADAMPMLLDAAVASARAQLAARDTRGKSA
ncbi:hypothetical protein [Streptomyces sp. NBC_01361]|uniref:hypothetical protein n=1 Tax=Streptomyces sp. NBC_01361 TaxID=2903838 RepID=UPI002E3625AC|nr:hypothetical protein [Streptomyces sp. NBC_01361]